MLLNNRLPYSLAVVSLKTLARCSEVAEGAGFAEVNLNIGCPSDRVQNAKIGACLMAEPELVAHCTRAMRAATRVARYR